MIDSAEDRCKPDPPSVIENLSGDLAVDSVVSVMDSTKSLFVALYVTEAVIESPA